MRNFAAAALACCGALALTLLQGGDAGAASSRALTKSTHFAYGACPATTTILKASIDHSSFSKGQLVVVHVTITNTSATACGAATTPHSTPGQLPGRVVVGQCGQISLQVDSLKGQNIYPGVQVIMCPFIPSPALAAKGSISATGTWDQMIYPPHTSQGRLLQPVPAGHYRLIIGGRLTFPITVKSTVHTP